MNSIVLEDIKKNVKAHCHTKHSHIRANVSFTIRQTAYSSI